MLEVKRDDIIMHYFHILDYPEKVGLVKLVNVGQGHLKIYSYLICLGTNEVPVRLKVI